jgi:hypothetical protein
MRTTVTKHRITGVILTIEFYGVGDAKGFFFQIAEYHTEEGGELKPTITHWPMPERRPKPNWIYMFLLKNAEDCYQLFEELYAAFNNGYNILTAMGLRTAFDRVAELLGAAQDKTFGEKVKFLAAQGLVGADERKALDVLVKAGNAVTHRRWSMESKEIELLILILENLVHRNLIVKFEVSLFEPRIPPRDEAKRS